MGTWCLINSLSRLLPEKERMQLLLLIPLLAKALGYLGLKNMKEHLLLLCQILEIDKTLKQLLKNRKYRYQSKDFYFAYGKSCTIIAPSSKLYFEHWVDQ